MHFTYLIATITSLGLAQAQLPNLPGCSLNCFLSALQNDGCSSLTNFTCHCAVPSLVGAITPCVQSACDLSDQSSVSNAVTSECSSAGVPISIPPISATSTGAGGTTTTGSGSAAVGSGTSGTVTPSRTSCSVKSSASATASSGTGGAGGVGGASSTSGTSGVTSGGSASSTSTGTGTGTTGTSATGVPQATGAAGSVSVPLVGTGLFAIGVAALFAL